MKIKLLILLVLISAVAFSQVDGSSTRKFIEGAQFTQINKDWNVTAEFKSGIGETVQFFPIEVIDLKSNTKVKALELDMSIKSPTINITAWVGIEEIDEFIYFIEKNVIPNLDLRFKKQSSEFIFRAKEMTFSFLVDERRRRITIKLNDYDGDNVPNYSFWTETQVDKIPYLLEVLKVIK